MNISWGDVNNVLEAGDYPFRDGTITVTFSEVAIWKQSPGAQFQLMRKHPIQTQFKYVLGKQVEDGSTPCGEQIIYQSSNGDTWFLARDPTTGAPAVKHVPNPQSGGQASYIEPEQFLSAGANGPEHQALRHLTETSIPLATLLIAYDIHPLRGPAYDRIIEAIKSLGAWWHHLETIWIVQCADTPAEIRDRLKPLIGFEDQLLVIDISGDTARWVGVNDIGGKWLEENL